MSKYSPITLRLFLSLLIFVGGLLGAIYWFTVPMIKSNVFGLELHANRQVLNVVYDLANRIHFNSETYIQRTLAYHEQRLRSIVELSENHIRAALAEGKAAGRSEAEVWAEVFQHLRQFKFGHDDYIWVAGYDSHILSHPSPRFHDKSMLDFKDPDGNLVIPRLVKLALDDGEGFYNYKWYRLDDTEVIDKYSYVKNFPDWGFVIGAGVYIDDVEREIRDQKAQAIVDISHALKDIKIANNGYLYVFDSQGNMLFHPNPNIHGRNFVTQLNPVTGHPIYQDLIAVADTGQELYYKWDRPDDQGNYVYEKLSLVRHLSGFDWYISSSVYLDDLKASSVQLSQRIMALGFFGLLAGVMAAFFFAEWITAPLRKLSLTAYRISRGNLTAKTGIRRDDELGTLAESFDYMVDRLRDNITTLNTRVNDRTRDLSESNAQLLRAVQSLQKTQGELKAVEERQRLILNALPAQVAYLDADQRFIFANREYLEMFGEDKRSIVGQKLAQVIGDKMYQDIEGYIQSALQGERVIYEYPLQFKGQDILTRRTVLPFFNEQGEVVGLLNLSIDITNERETERRLAEASKMKAVGQMSGGLAHDFNNLLTIILGNLLELQQYPDLPKSLSNNLAPAIRATRRGADMTRRLLAFSRRQPLQPDYIRPEVLIRDLVSLLKAPLPENVELKTCVVAGSPGVYLDAAQMEDALVNMALNSVDAMPKGGTLALHVSGFEAKPEQPMPEGYDEPVPFGLYMHLQITDTGEGFSDDALQKAFEPFFTTKATGAGSGLGLSMVYGFVKQSQGYIRLSNRPQGGASIELLLPAASPKLPGRRSSEIAKTSVIRGDGHALVLLVEDNEDVRRVVRRQLLELGFQVLEATSADEALTMLGSGLPELSGLVTDVVMPGKHDGYEVAVQVHKLFAKAFIVLMTGYSEPPPALSFNFALLQKPFTSESLNEAIQRTAGEGSGSENG
ncbi:cache domain-containing protein [Neptuniibacter sp. CAU 1671]|uniref:cache domain-containing protein n=1 Tax=Neptuniibacter sp. CAU 1671 TaxID=3032593 RepID=UPI0023DC3377|nr:cache domain-containing protein [Neptuniibacter sp. CAU 1671]MDF2182071.1 cache domain-containing protein [Neptuniibacter sp. CAU 1671]